MGNKHIWWACAINNGINLICWTALAIIFGHWWIVFFAILFMSSAKTTEEAVKDEDKETEQ